MADTITITSLPDATVPLNGSEYAALDQGPLTVKARISDIRAVVNNAFSGARTEENVTPVPAHVFTDMVAAATRYDVDGYWTSGAADRFTAPFKGFFHFGAWVGFTVGDTSFAGPKSCYLAGPGDYVISQMSFIQADLVNGLTGSLSGDIDLLAGDTVAVRCTAGNDGVDAVCAMWIHAIGTPSPPPPVGRTLYDTFTGIDGTSLTVHPMNEGPGWTIFSGDWQIQADHAQLVTFGGGGQQVVVSDCGSGNCTVSCICDPTTVYDFALVFNGVDAANYWMLNPNQGIGQLRLFSQVGASFNLVASVALTLTSGTPITLQVIASGDTVNGYVDGVLLLTYTVGGRPLQGDSLCGLRIGSEIVFGTTFDDFQAFI